MIHGCHLLLLLVGNTYRDLEDMRDVMADLHQILHDRGDDIASGMLYVCLYFHVNYYAPTSKSHSIIKV